MTNVTNEAPSSLSVTSFQYARSFEIGVQSVANLVGGAIVFQRAHCSIDGVEFRA